MNCVCIIYFIKKLCKINKKINTKLGKLLESGSLPLKGNESRVSLVLS